MKKFKKSVFNVLSSTALLATVVTPVAAVVAPVVSHAATAGTISAFTVPTIAQQGKVDLGTVLLDIPSGALTGSSDTVTLSLPHGFTFNGAQPDIKTVTNGTYSDSVVVTQIQGSAVTGTVEVLGSNDQIKIQLATANGTPVGTSSSSDDVKLSISLKNINANGPSTGPVNVSVDAPTTSAFPTGSVAVANVQTNGEVDLAATDTTSGNNNFTFNLDVKEEVAGSLRTDNNALKIKLPSGYAWTVPAGQASALKGASELYGDTSVLNNVYLSTSGDDTLYIRANSATALASAMKLPLTFTVRDDTQTHNGPINAYISGTSTSNVSSLQVGLYGDYNASISAASTPTIYAGQANQKIGDLVIKESVPGTFVNGRTVELTLPDSARWEDVFESIINNNGEDPSSDKLPTPALNITTTNGLNVTPSFTGTDYRTLKLTFNGTGSQGGTDPGEIDLKNVLIAAHATAKDITLAVSGSAGVTGNVNVATATPPGTISVSDVKNFEIGSNNQPVGDITITEAAPGVFNKDTVAGVTNSGMIAVNLNHGVQWDTDPKVTVTDGDAKITNVYDDGSTLYIQLDSASGAKAATLKLTGGSVILDRNVVKGPFNVRLRGTAVDFAANKVDVWNNDTTDVASAQAGTVTTGIDGSSTGTAKFTIGKTDYTVNGQQKTLDVAPYTEGGRTYLPIRFVAEALGISDDNIIWNNKTQTVTIIKGDRVAAFQVGRDYYTLNGSQVQMDAAAQIKAGRNMIPLRYAAQAVGAQVQWDDATQTVTIN